MEVKKSSQEIGNEFENHVLDFFVWLFNEIGFSVLKERKQKAGTQNGFDVFLKIIKDNSIHRIFIECKNYKSNIEIAQILQKAMEIESNYILNSENDIFIAISPKTNFSNRNEPDRIKPLWKNKFPFKIELLEENNNVNKIFALNPILYNKIYGKELGFEIDKKKEIERFKEIIFSTKIFKYLELNENDKSHFIGDIKPNENFIERTLLSNNDENFHRYFEGESVSQVIDKESFIAVLGNPGTGKTSLLKKIALKYWKEGKQNSYTPIYKNLRDFPSQQNLENYLPTKLKNIPYPLFILDGIDEIQNIEHFKSELNLFIQKYNENCKYIISCRNNIYNSVVRSVSNFKTYHLKDLSYDESIKLLQKLCRHINIKDFTLNNRHLEFIRTPQQTEILAEYINKNNKLSNNFSELWGAYIEQRLKDNYGKLEKRPYDNFLFTNEAPKVGVIGELMQTTVLSKTDLKKLLNNNYRDVNEFALSPLINSNDYTFSFENRNIQEYFASKVFSKLKKEKILSQFIINDCNKIHPNLINTLSFLLQLVDDSTHDFIVDWLLKNESELFFKFDNSRISKHLKTKILQDYFQKQCIDKSLWISEIYKIEEIAKFSDCPENQQFLINIITNEDFHFRVIQSALYLLGHFSIHNNEKELVELFEKMIGSKGIDLKTKEEVLNTIYLLKLTRDNHSFLSFLLESFADYDEQGIRYHLMKLLELELSIDKHFSFFFEEFKKENNLENRKVSSSVTMGGYEWVIDKLLLRIESDDLFLKVFKLFFTKEYKVYSKITDKLLQKAVDKIKKNNKFIIELYEEIDKDYLLYSKKQKFTILKLCELSETENYLCEHIAKIFPRKDYLNISLFITQSNIDLIISIILQKKNNVKNKEFERLRNDIRWGSSIELAVLFDEKLQKRGITFEQPVLTVEKENEQKSSFLNFKQENFDLLFNKETLLKNIKKIFEENNNVIDFDILREVENSWADDKGQEYYNYTSVINVIDEILHHYSSGHRPKINFQFVEEKVQEYPVIFFEKIKEQLDNDPLIKITDIQIKQIHNWCKTVIKEIKLDDIWTLDEDRKGFNYLNYDYKKIEIIYYFKNKLKIDIEKSFILNSLPYLFGYDSKKEIFDEVKDWYGNRLEFEKHIIKMLQSKSLPFYIEAVYIDYAIENYLISLEKEIKTHFLIDDYHSSSNFSLFIENFQLQNSLKDYCVDINTSCCWNALKMLLQIDTSNKKFCCQKSIEYIQTQNTKNTWYKRNALEILFQSNHSYVFEYILERIQEDNFQDLESSDLIESNAYSYYDNDKIIIQLFDFIYLNDWKNIRDVYYLKEFFERYIENLVENHYGKIKNIFEKKLKNKEEKDTLFHLNRLLNIINKKQISNLSKPMKFNDAFEFVSSL